jgi:hypothetical protein
VNTRSTPAKQPTGARFSDELRVWAASGGDGTVGSLIDTFGEKSFALLFVLLLGPSALPLPTGGVTNVFEVIAMLLALQLLIGRQTVWLPQRWRNVALTGPKSERFVERLLRLIAWLERRSRPRGRFLFGSRPSNAVFGALVFIGTAGAFIAPPFSTLDTLPSLGVVVLSVGVLVEDVVIVGAGVAIGAGGVALLLALGRAAARGIADLL